MNPTVKKRIDLQVSQQQLKIHTGSTANFLTREDSSRDLLGTFHKDRSVWIRARRRVLQCLSYQFPCARQLKQWGIPNDVKCRLCEKYYEEKNIRDPPDTGGKCRTYTMLLPSSVAPTNSHTSWNMEGTDVLDTEILY